MKILTASRVTAALLSLVFIHYASSVLIPLLLAVMCSLLLDPVVVYFENRGASRALSSAGVLLGFLSLITLTAWLTYLPCSNAIDHAPVYLEKLRTFVAPVIIPLRAHTATIHNGANSAIFGLVGSAFEVVSIALFVPLFIFYFLMDKSNLIESFNVLMGGTLHLRKFNTELPKMIRTFFRGNFIGGVLLVVLHALAFFTLGLRNPVGLALISGFLNLIPILGAPLALLFPFAQGLLQWNDVLPFVFLAIATFAFHFTVGNVVIPQIIGSRVNVNPAALLTGLLFWGWIWGPMGFLLAIPLTATIKIALESNSASASLANLLSARPRHVISPLTLRQNRRGEGYRTKAPA